MSRRKIDEQISLDITRLKKFNVDSMDMMAELNDFVSYIHKIGSSVLKRKKPSKVKPYRMFIRPVIDVLNKSKIQYMFTGAVGVNFYGRPRASMDVDIIIESDKTKVMKLIKLLKINNFDVDVNSVKEAIKEGSHFSAFSDFSPYYIDFKVVKPEEKHFFDRVKRVKIYGKKISLTSSEDLIVNKLLFASEKDINDVKSILKRQGKKIDQDYLFPLAKKHGVYKILAELFHE